MASARLRRVAASTPWSLHTLCVTLVSVRSMSTTENCHIASRKTGRFSCVAFICDDVMPPIIGSAPALLGSVLASSALSASSLTVLNVRTAAAAARTPALAAAAWFWIETPLPLIAAMWPSTPSRLPA